MKFLAAAIASFSFVFGFSAFAQKAPEKFQLKAQLLVLSCQQQNGGAEVCTGPGNNVPQDVTITLDTCDNDNRACYGMWTTTLLVDGMSYDAQIIANHILNGSGPTYEVAANVGLTINADDREVAMLDLKSNVLTDSLTLAGKVVHVKQADGTVVGYMPVLGISPAK